MLQFIRVGVPNYDSDLSDFPDSLSPMMLASKIGEFSILKQLILHYKIMKLHPPNCLYSPNCA